METNLNFDFSSNFNLNGLATNATHKLHKKEVCSFWIQNRCAKGDQCEFLHMLDYAKMPMCKLGDHCTLRDVSCMYKHPDKNRLECPNYQLGFCSFGRRCKYLHRTQSSVPEVNPYWTPEYTGLKIEEHSSKDFFRKKPCAYYLQNKWCPYFDMCNFSH